MPIVIKKRVSLDFLGEEYKGAYLEFKSIPLKDYDEILAAMPDEEDNKAANALVVKYLKQYYLGGKFPEDGKLTDVSVEDLDDLDGPTAVKCFETLMGQLDPKGEASSTTQSSTTDQPPQN